MQRRQSSYRRNYQVDSAYSQYGGSSSSNGEAAIQYSYGGEIRVMKEKEREQLKGLNNSLMKYLSKVNELEFVIKRLAAENASLRRNQESFVQIDLSALYENEMMKLRSELEELHTRNVRIVIERDNKAHDYQDISEKFKSKRKALQVCEGEVKDLRKDVDAAAVEKVSFEQKIKMLTEQLKAEREHHKAELENLRGKIQPVEVFSEQMVEQKSMIPDLTDAIAKVRKEYETFNAKSLEDLDAFYKEKIENLSKQLKAAHVEIKQLKTEAFEKGRSLQQLQSEITVITEKKVSMEKSIKTLERHHADAETAKEKELSEIKMSLDTTKQDLGKYLKQYQELNALKLSLDQEIAIYKKLIHGGELRIAELDASSIISDAGVQQQQQQIIQPVDGDGEQFESKTSVMVQKTTTTTTSVVDQMMDLDSVGGQHHVQSIDIIPNEKNGDKKYTIRSKK